MPLIMMIFILVRLVLDNISCMSVFDNCLHLWYCFDDLWDCSLLCFPSRRESFFSCYSSAKNILHWLVLLFKNKYAILAYNRITNDNRRIRVIHKSFLCEIVVLLIWIVCCNNQKNNTQRGIWL